MVRKWWAAFKEARELLRLCPNTRLGLFFPATLKITPPNWKQRSFDDPIEARKCIIEHLQTKSGGSNWIGQVYCSNFDHNSRGVDILLKKGMQFDEHKSIQDTNGRYIILIGRLCNTPVVLVNIYGPNWHSPQFYTDLVSALPNINTHKLIIAGDLNCFLDPFLDRSNPRRDSQLSKAATVISFFVSPIHET